MKDKNNRLSIPAIFFDARSMKLIHEECNARHCRMCWHYEYAFENPVISFPEIINVISILQWIIRLNCYCDMVKVSAKTKKKLIRSMKEVVRMYGKDFILYFVTAYKLGEVISKMRNFYAYDLKVHEITTLEGFQWWMDLLEVSRKDLRSLDFENPSYPIAFLEEYDRQP